MRLQGTALQAGAARCSLCSVQGLCPWLLIVKPSRLLFIADRGIRPVGPLRCQPRGVPSPCYLHLALNADGWEGARDDEIFLSDTYGKK